MSLLVNGYEDIVTRVNFFNPFEQSLISVGQYKLVGPYVGKLNNMLLLLKPFNDQEILRMAKDYNLHQILKDLHYSEDMDNFVQGGSLPQSKFM